MKPEQNKTKQSHRSPAIHIREDDLQKVLDILGITIPVRVITEHCFKYAIKDRLLIKKSNVTKVEKLVSSSEEMAEKFNAILMYVRRSKGFIGGLQHIKKTDKDYPLLKEISLNAHHFVEEFKIKPIEEGLHTYCSLGIDLMKKKYGLNKFKYYHEQICGLYNDYMVISNDSNPDLTTQIYEFWDRVMKDETGITYGILKDDITKYVHFIYAREEVEKYQADYKDWIFAQFDGLSFLNAVPELSQFYGPSSLDRYKKYMAKKGKIDQGVKEEFEDEGIAEYYKALRATK